MAKLVPAKCPSCGGTIVVDPDKDAAVCEYCNNAFIVSKAITNYNTINNVTINEVKQDNEWTYKTEQSKHDSTVIKIVLAIVALLFILMFLDGVVI